MKTLPITHVLVALLLVLVGVPVTASQGRLAEGTAEKQIQLPKVDESGEVTQLAPDVRGRLVKEMDRFRVLDFSLKVMGRPFDSSQQFQHGPDSHANMYGDLRHFFPVNHPEYGLGVIWQDQGNRGMQLTWFGKGMREIRHTWLRNIERDTLVAAAMDSEGMVYYFTVTAGSLHSGEVRRATLFKATSEGEPVGMRGFDTSAKGLNIKGFGRNSGSMSVSGNRVALIFSRTMFNGHQGAIARIFDTEKLEIIKRVGQTSSHSFDNILGVDSQGRFLGMDLGDNYPRGLHLHHFDADKRASRVVYTFKTAHGRKPKIVNGESTPRLRGIGSCCNPFYAWSNDNATYTELGGVVETENAFVTVFAGEASESGRALDNARTRGRHIDSRNLGLVAVRKDFHKTLRKKGTLINPDMILSRGVSESGGFYDFGGNWKPQNNVGVVWLTRYKDRHFDNASRVKLARLPDGSLLVLWEHWNFREYVNTRMLRIDEAGRRLGPIQDLGSTVRLGRREDPITDGRSVFLVSGRESGSQLRVLAIEWKSDSASHREEMRFSSISRSVHSTPMTKSSATKPTIQTK